MKRLARYSGHDASIHQDPIRLGLACVLGLWCCVSLCSCSGRGSSQALEGTVTLDGQPLAAGGIDFIPLPGTQGPTAGGQIVEGSFHIVPKGNTMAGTFRVMINASRKSGKQIFDPTASAMDPEAMNGMVDEYEQYIPARYNEQSELTAEVTADGQETFEFALSSQP